MTNLPNTTKLILNLDAGWLTIWFNSPENRNALSDALSNELKATLNAVKDDRNVRGITLRGKGGIFCAGGDLKGMKTGFHGDKSQEDRRKAVITMSNSAGELFELVNTMPQVVIVLIEGAAIAGGLGLACCADIVAVTKDAKFALTETRLGITPAQIAPYIVQRFGLNTARRLMLTGARFSGEDALGLGLADYVVEEASGFDAIEADIRRNVSLCAPGANAVTKKIVLKATHLEGDALITFAAEGFADCMMSDEGREGIASFVEKRKPKWALAPESGEDKS